MIKLLIIKEIEKNSSIELKNIMKVTKKDIKREYGRNIYQNMSKENMSKRISKINIKNFYLFFFTWCKNGQKALIFDKQCINKNAFLKNKKPITIDKVENKIIVLSKKDSYGKKGSFKYFIGYINETDAFPLPLCIKLPQMNGHVKYFDSNNKCMNLLVHDKELLKKYNEIWDKISNLLKKGLIVNQCMIINTLKLK